VRSSDVLPGFSQLRRQPWRGLFLRYFTLTGVQAFSGIAVRAAMLGTLVIGYVINVIAADAQMAALLLVIVLREGVPLLAALLVVAKSGVEITGQLAGMRERGEVRGLRLLGISASRLLVVPILLAITAATVVLTLYFEILAVGGGMAIAGLIMALSPLELLEHFVALASPGDLFYSLFKSAAFGFAVAAVICHFGLRAPLDRRRDLPATVSRAVMQCLFFIALVNTVFVYMTQGLQPLGIGSGG